MAGNLETAVATDTRGCRWRPRMPKVANSWRLEVLNHSRRVRRLPV